MSRTRHHSTADHPTHHQPRGYEYTYFFCRNTQNGTCPTPHVNVLRIEEAVEEHYATIRFTPDFITEVRAHVGAALADEEAMSYASRSPCSTGPSIVGARPTSRTLVKPRQLH